MIHFSTVSGMNLSFSRLSRDVESKYQAEHERVRKWLEEAGEAIDII